jgi:hypothetical protein
LPGAVPDRARPVHGWRDGTTLGALDGLEEGTDEGWGDADGAGLILGELDGWDDIDGAGLIVGGLVGVGAGVGST